MSAPLESSTLRTFVVYTFLTPSSLMQWKLLEVFLLNWDLHFSAVVKLVFGNIRTVKLCFHGFDCELQAIICFQCWSCLPGIQFFIHCLEVGYQDNRWRCILVPYYSAAIRVMFWSNLRCEPVRLIVVLYPICHWLGCPFSLASVIKCESTLRQITFTG